MFMTFLLFHLLDFIFYVLTFMLAYDVLSSLGLEQSSNVSPNL